MKIVGTILALVATVTAQNFVSVLPFVEQPQYAPIQPLTPFNVVQDGFNGYNPSSNIIALPQQVPPMTPAYNNIAPLPYQYPIPYPHPAYPNPTYPQFPVFPQFPQLFPQQQLPQFPNFFQPALHPAYPSQVIQHGAPQSNAAAVSYTNYQTHAATPPQPTPQPAIAPAQGVNGLTKPVSTPLGSGNQAYGSAFGKYEPVSTSTQAARYEAISGSTVHTAALPGHEANYTVVSGQAPVTTAAGTTTAGGMQ